MVTDRGTVVFTRKLVNDEQPIRELVADIDRLADEVSWTVQLTTVYANLRLPALTEAGRSSVFNLGGRQVWQASVIYRGRQGKAVAKDVRVLADQSRMRGVDLPVLRPDDDLITELQILTVHRPDLVTDHTRGINRLLRQPITAECPPLQRAAQLTPDRRRLVLLSRYQRPKAIRQKGLSKLT